MNILKINVNGYLTLLLGSHDNVDINRIDAFVHDHHKHVITAFGADALTPNFHKFLHLAYFLQHHGSYYDVSVCVHFLTDSAHSSCSLLVRFSVLTLSVSTTLWTRLPLLGSMRRKRYRSGIGNDIFLRSAPPIYRRGMQPKAKLHHWCTFNIII